jgi:hypothetical protein
MRGSITFLNQPIEEAQNLLKSSRDYIKWQAPLDIQETDSNKTSKITHEALRIVMRLSQITVWLTIQKAVQQREISLEESLSKDHHVLRGKSCLEMESEIDPDLPPRLRDLLRTSRLLYERILRLNEVSHRHALSANTIKKEKKIRAV